MTKTYDVLGSLRARHLAGPDILGGVSETSSKTPHAGTRRSSAREDQTNDVGRRAGSADIAAGGHHRGLVAVLDGSLSHPASPNLLHMESVAALHASGTARAQAEPERSVRVALGRDLQRIRKSSGMQCIRPLMRPTTAQ